jgi:hypothetical protein
MTGICALLPLPPHRRLTKIRPATSWLQRSYFFIQAVGRSFQPQLRARLDAEAHVGSRSMSDGSDDDASIVAVNR